MNTEKISRKARTWGTLVVLGAVAVAPLVSTPQTAQAAPRTGRWQNVTVQGTVAADLAGQKDFTVRLSNGRTVEVVTREVEPPRLSRGDRVEMTGHYDGNLFVARTVRILQDAGSGSGAWNAQNITVQGTVAADLAGQKDFTVRLNNGRTVEVVTRETEPVRLSRGDRVEMTGHYDGNLFVARTVRILRDVPIGSGQIPDNTTPWIDFRGTVTSVEAGRWLRVRSEGGVNYAVQSHDPLPRGLTAGDFIRVAGRVSGSTVRPDHVDLLRNEDYNTGRGGVVLGRDNVKVDFRGRVVSVESAYQLVVRAGDGRNYRVRTNDRLPSAVTAGDTVDLEGRFLNGTVRTDHITLVRNNTYGNNLPNGTTQSGQTVNFVGTIVSVNRVFGGIGDLEVRGDNGRIYNVRTKNATSFERGDRVRVIGTYNNDRISASSVTRI